MRRGRNPELLVVDNPRRSGKKRGVGTMQRKRSASPLTVLYAGKDYSYRGLVKKLHGVRAAAKVWRKAPKRHRRQSVRWGRKSRAGSGWRTPQYAPNHPLKVRVRGRKYTYRNLLKKFGRSQTEKQWRRPKFLNRKKRFFRSRDRFGRFRRGR